MKKVIRLAESDLVKLIGRVINEQETEKTIENVLNSPKIEKAAEESVRQMSSKDLQDLKGAFSKLGVSPTSSFGEIKRAVENLQPNMNNKNEMTEDEEMSPKKKMWRDVKMVLALLGMGNFALYAAPFSILFDKLIGLDQYSQASDNLSIIVSLLLMIIGGWNLFDSKKK